MKPEFTAFAFTHHQPSSSATGPLSSHLLSRIIRPSAQKAQLSVAGDAEQPGSPRTGDTQAPTLGPERV